jgi:hypothetical protein
LWQVAVGCCPSDRHAYGESSVRRLKGLHPRPIASKAMTMPSCFANDEPKGNILVEAYSYLSVGSPNHATLSAVAVDNNVKPPWKIRGGGQTQSRACV